MSRITFTLIALFFALPSYAGTPGTAAPAVAVTNATTQALVRQVSRSVVQVVVTGYEPTSDNGEGTAVARSRSIGSGAAIAAGGFIVTNAHVVAGAQRIDVVLPDEGGENTPFRQLSGRSVAASLIGVAPEL